VVVLTAGVVTVVVEVRAVAWEVLIVVVEVGTVEEVVVEDMTKRSREQVACFSLS
jgi:hypothetical protein